MPNCSSAARLPSCGSRRHTRAVQSRADLRSKTMNAGATSPPPIPRGCSPTIGGLRNPRLRLDRRLRRRCPSDVRGVGQGRRGTVAAGESDRHGSAGAGGGGGGGGVTHHEHARDGGRSSANPRCRVGHGRRREEGAQDGERWRGPLAGDGRGSAGQERWVDVRMAVVETCAWARGLGAQRFSYVGADTPCAATCSGRSRAPRVTHGHCRFIGRGGVRGGATHELLLHYRSRDFSFWREGPLSHLRRSSYLLLQ